MAKKTKEDPTGQRVNRAKSSRRIDNRLTTAQRQVLRLFRDIPRARRKVTVIQNEQQSVYDYDISPQDLESLGIESKDIIADELGTATDTVPDNWWYKQDVELPYRQGTMEELNNLNQLIAGAVVAGVLVKGMPPRTVATESVLRSIPYRQSLYAQYVRSYSSIKGVGDKVGTQIISRIESGIAAGESPTKIVNDIVERFDVAKSDIRRIVTTEINGVYNRGVMDAIDTAEGQSGLRSAVRHIAQFKSTSRQTHLDRHNKIYTVSSQRTWWATGSNSINCGCKAEGVLVDSKGKVIS